MHPEQIQVVHSAEEIQARVKAVAAEINRDYKGESIHCLGILKGAFVFMADLVRHLDVEMTCDFLTISSYGDETKSSGVVKLLTDLTVPIENRHVLVIEDIVDTGLTLKYMLENLQTRGPKSIKVCSFLSKPSRREVEVPIDYLGFEIPNVFAVGYGMDDRQTLRNLPFLGSIEGGE